jgi:hypothetical protein
LLRSLNFGSFEIWRRGLDWCYIILSFVLQILYLPISSKTAVGKHSSDPHDDETNLSSDSDFADR